MMMKYLHECGGLVHFHQHNKELPLDCNDDDATIYVGASELCDGLDNDCDSNLPNEESDDDDDGFVECTIDSNGWDGSITGGFTEMESEDCDDTDSDTYPGAGFNEADSSAVYCYDRWKVSVPACR